MAFSHTQAFKKLPLKGVVGRHRHRKQREARVLLWGSKAILFVVVAEIVRHEAHVRLFGLKRKGKNKPFTAPSEPIAFDAATDKFLRRENTLLGPVGDSRRSAVAFLEAGDPLLLDELRLLYRATLIPYIYSSTTQKKAPRGYHGAEHTDSTHA